ncbi:MAG: 1-deoxy-D-xylulose-5-phosphate synthase [Pirellulales bacterium]|nr:1-deoxy-D-xylulose-5-phosphate synthase [Pirellulales bacterium]
MDRLLSQIESPLDLSDFSNDKLDELAAEMREVLCNLVSKRTAHFASNLGVIELCLALHTEFDFRTDRLIWDTGHQIYPQKLITGRYHEFPTIRTRGGLMGYPNPQESEYDLFMTGHAGCSVATVMGLHAGDELQGESQRQAVAVIGDGAFPSGIVFEAFNNAAGMRSKLLVVLNDNEMSICPRVGGLASYLDRLRMNPYYRGFKDEVSRIIKNVPVIGDQAERFVWQMKEAIKAGVHGGMLFEELGFKYFGPIDGHNIRTLRKTLKKVKQVDGPVLLHVLTEKGHGFQPAAEDPVFFHTPAPFEREEENVVAIKKSKSRAYTNVASSAILEHLERNDKATVLTAAMCQGNNLEVVRDTIPKRFFDTGICESFAVAFAAGQAKAGMRPIVAIYSTFLQRSYDQIFQEVALQNLPVTFMLDRAGLTGPDGPTHHGMFDIGYMRVFPNMVVMAPGDAFDLPLMLEFAQQHPAPVSIRYPKTTAEEIARDVRPVQFGKSEIVREGKDGTIIAFGTLLPNAVAAAKELEADGLKIRVINARFAKPLDRETILDAVSQTPFVITVEEGALNGGFGSAVLEAAADAGVAASHVKRLGVPDQFIEHGDRAELLADLNLDMAGLVKTCRELASAEASASDQQQLTGRANAG